MDQKGITPIAAPAPLSDSPEWRNLDLAVLNVEMYLRMTKLETINFTKTAESLHQLGLRRDALLHQLRRTD